MFGSSVLETAIGLIFVFFLVSLLCSEVGNWIARIGSFRANHLERWIREVLMDGDRELVKKLYASPVIRSICPGAKRPEAIPAEPFLLAVFDALVPDAAGKTTVSEIREAVDKLDDRLPYKKKLQALFLATENRVEIFHANFECWFNSVEDAMTRAYRRHMRIWSLVIGLGVAVAFNVDAIHVGTRLWRDPTLRSSVAAEAARYVSEAEKQTDPAVRQEMEKKAREEIMTLGLPVGWHAGEARPPFGLMALGWFLTALAAAQGAPFWFDTLRKVAERK